jgi:EAL domain-containing protein (putative c-di-GMP-specific phosphodiesterase class I)
MMNRDAEQLARLDDAIMVDEIGIESGGYGIYRLRTLYQPIFERRGRKLQAVAVEGTVAPFLGAEEVPSEIFLSAASPDDLAFIEQMSLVLPVRNHRNIGLPTLELVVGVRSGESVPDATLDRARLVASASAEIGLDASLVVCALSEPPAQDGGLLSRLAAEMRGRLRIAIGDFGAGRWTEAQMDALGPEIVRIDGDWFGKVCRDATTVRLFDSVVARVRERKTKVLVAGIDNEQQFGVALRAGADLFQGGHLAPPAHVGTVFDEAPLPIADKLGGSRNILPLFG